MSILEKLYAQGGTDVILNTVEFQCQAWAEPLVLVRDYVDHIITTEDSRTLTAFASGMDVAIPKRDSTAAQKLVFAIDGVNMQATTMIRDAIERQMKIKMIYRTYVSSDLSEPAGKPFNFYVHAIKITGTRVDVTAGLFDFIDMRWPRAVFNDNTAPCLKYVQ